MFFRAILDILFPPICHYCKTFIPDAGDIHLCGTCMEDVVSIESPHCKTCGLPFQTEGGIDHVCGGCLMTRRPFDAARAAAVFSGPVQELVHRFKYGKKVHLRRPLALLTVSRLSPFIGEVCPDIVIPVPLHARRLRERGFNQAVLLGEVLAKEWRLPLSRRDLQRIRWTDPQVGLTAAEREANVRGAFAVADPSRMRGKRVLLVDDVYTTGSTVAECARVLKRAGAEAVLVATVARAV